MTTIVVSMKLIAIAALFAACTTNNDITPDAPDATTPDAVVCEPSLPACVSLYCAIGAIAAECPHAEDTSVCWCPSSTPGWCRQ